MADHRLRPDPQRTSAIEQDIDSAVSPRVMDTVRTGAKALFASRSRVLLIEERRADGSTFWTLPGGGVKPTESLRDGLHRELREELRCAARLSEDVDSCLYRHRTKPDTVTHYTIVSGTLLTSPDPNASEDVVGYEWVDPENPPETTLPPIQDVIRDSGPL
ncbi:NUDIX hydrolase [Halobellus limi]|uniref:NUDIX hydrolase n=2 Tax=Halobellus limi TaxID=699433 RepID=A0A4D6H1J0_9EURY|nr:NUDIX hydrolase [Halobellus limi]